MNKIKNLGFCPRCKEDFPMMTRIVDKIVFCHLCSFEVEELSMELEAIKRYVKDYAEGGGNVDWS